MFVRDIFSFLDTLAPFSYAMDFDNSGLLAGDPKEPVRRILVALDCTEAVVGKARETGTDLIVTHHPVIFDPLKTVTAGSIVHQLISAGISIICAHTNLDLARGGVNDHLARQLGLKCLEGLTPVPCTDREGKTITEYLGRSAWGGTFASPAGNGRYTESQSAAVPARIACQMPSAPVRTRWSLRRSSIIFFFWRPSRALR